MHKLLNAIVFETTVKGNAATPLVGYYLENLATGRTFVCSREEACAIASGSGIENAEARKRSVSCEEDRPNGEGEVSFLKISDGRKINETLMRHEDIPENAARTDAYKQAVLRLFQESGRAFIALENDRHGDLKAVLVETKDGLIKARLWYNKYARGAIRFYQTEGEQEELLENAEAMELAPKIIEALEGASQ